MGTEKLSEIKSSFDYGKNIFSEAWKDHPEGLLEGCGVRYQNSIFQRDGWFFSFNSDSIGTKTDLADRLHKFDKMAFNLVAMIADDGIRDGIKPNFITNVIDTRRSSEKVISELRKSLSIAAAYAGADIAGGETAELGGYMIRGYSKNAFLWSGTAIGISRKKPIDLRKIKHKDAIISLYEKSLRSNGFTLARKILENQYGSEWHNAKFNGEMWGSLLLEPSTIYTPVVADILEEYRLKGIAHITGGGIPEKLRRVLAPTNLSAVVEPFDAQDFAKELQKLGRIPDAEAYKQWNMGQGMLLVCNKRNAEGVRKIAEEHNLESRIVGEVTRTNEAQTIRIASKGYFSSGRTIVYK